VPGAVVNLTGFVAGSVVSISWSPAFGGGAPDSYVVYVGSAPGQSNVLTLPVSASTAFVSASAPPGAYFVRVGAENACGSGPNSNEISLTVAGPTAPPGPPSPTPAPGAPLSLAAQVIGSQVTLTWAAPASGGVPTRYIIVVSDQAGMLLATLDTGNATTTFTHAGVPPGVYVVTVQAANAGGTGPASAAVTVTIAP
jgi:hypothetical protein